MSDEAGTTQTTDAGAADATPADTLSEMYQGDDASSADQDTGADKNATTQDSSEADQNADQGKDDKSSADTPDDSSKADDADDKPKDGDSKDGEDQDGDKDDEDASKADGKGYDEFSFPEGMEVDQDSLDEVSAILSEAKVPQDQAQKVMDVGAKMMSKMAEQASKLHTETVEKWGADTKEHFGKDGDAAFDEKSATAKMAMEKFFSPQEMQYIDAWGVGNMPGLFGMAEAIGRAMKEDNSFASNAGQSNKEETVADIWYPNNNG